MNTLSGNICLLLNQCFQIERRSLTYPNSKVELRAKSATALSGQYSKKDARSEF